jgi:hypothetical protein
MSTLTTALSLENPYLSLDEALRSLQAIEGVLRAEHDRRAVFATAYSVITDAIRERVRAGWFGDNAWAERYAVAFANLYREALAAYEAGATETLPKSWRFSFDTSRSGRGLLIQDLVLGVNAHVNHDLALALQLVGIDPDRQARYADHTLVNAVLAAATDRLQDQVCELYAPILGLLDLAGGRLDETLASFSVTKARESAWRIAVALANARDDGERALLRTGLDDAAAVLARLILSPNAVQPWLIQALLQVERVRPWWERVTLGQLAAEPLVVARPAAI